MHADIEDFLEMKKNHGDDEMRARDLFYGLWIPDLFMEKVERDEEWCLFCPSKCPGLSDVYGKSFKEMYNLFEDQGLYNKRGRLINAKVVLENRTVSMDQENSLG